MHSVLRRDSTCRVYFPGRTDEEGWTKLEEKPAMEEKIVAVLDVTISELGGGSDAGGTLDCRLISVELLSLDGKGEAFVARVGVRSEESEEESVESSSPPDCSSKESGCLSRSAESDGCPGDVFARMEVDEEAAGEVEKREGEREEEEGTFMGEEEGRE